jgi:hypothetical protein
VLLHFDFWIPLHMLQSSIVFAVGILLGPLAFSWPLLGCWWGLVVVVCGHVEVIVFALLRSGSGLVWSPVL